MADPKPIQQKIDVKADTSGADQAERALDELKGATREAGQETEKATRATRQNEDAMESSARATRRAGSETDKTADKKGFLARTADALKGSIGSLVGGIIGFGGAVAAFQAWREEIEQTNQRLIENEQIVRRSAEARIDLVALRGFEDPEQIKELDRLAVFSGRSVGEAARLATVTQSILPDGTYTDDQRSEFLQEVAIQGQTSSASLTEIAGAIYPLIVEGLTARQASNLYQTGIKQAGEPDPAQFGQSAARFVSVGREVGGLDVGEAVGFAAGATGLGLDRSEAETGLKNLVLGIRTPNNEDSKALLERLNISDETDLQDALRIISESYAGGDVSKQDLVNLSGREGLAVTLKLAREETLAAFTNRVSIVDAAEDLPGNIAAEQSANINKPGTIQGYNLLAKQAEAGEAATRASDVKAARRSAAKKQLARLLTEKVKAGELSEADTVAIQTEFDYQLAQGKSIEAAIDIAEQQQSGVHADIPIPDGAFKASLNRVNLNPLKFLGGTTRGQDDFLKDDLIDRLEEGPELPESVDQSSMIAPADRDDMVNKIVRRLQAQGYDIGQQTVIHVDRVSINNGTNYQGLGNPLYDHLDGRDRV